MNKGKVIRSRCYNPANLESRNNFGRHGEMFLATAFVLSLCSLHCSGLVLDPVTHTENPLVAQYTVSVPVGSTAAVEFGPDTNYGFTTSAITATAPTVS